MKNKKEKAGGDVSRQALTPALSHWERELSEAPVFERYRGRHIAVSEGEEFVADDAWEAQRLAKEKHPDDEPFMQYIPRERIERIYAC